MDYIDLERENFGITYDQCPECGGPIENNVCQAACCKQILL